MEIGKIAGWVSISAVDKEDGKNKCISCGDEDLGDDQDYCRSCYKREVEHNTSHQAQQKEWVKKSFFPETEPEDRYDRVPIQVEPQDQHEYTSTPLEYDKREWINKPDSAVCLRSGGKGDDESWSYTWVFDGRPSEQELMNWAEDNNVDWSAYYGGPGRGFYDAASILRSGGRTLVKQQGGMDI